MTAKTLLLVVLLVACSNPQQPGSSTSPHTRGPLGDTWIGDGGTWHQVAAGGPSSRYQASVAFDAQRDDFVLFGGQTARGTSDETWTWQGNQWTQRSPAHRPQPRRTAAMAYDPHLQVVVLYGGLVPDQAEGFEAADTWTWDGTDWTKVDTPAKGPGPREAPVMVSTYDGVLMFGGHIGNLSYFADVWTFNGSAWSRVDRDPTPPGRGGAAAIWSPLDHSLLISGGLGLRAGAGPGNLGVPLDDSWSMTNSVWSRLEATGPPATAYAGSAWDPQRNRQLVMFGMVCPNPTNAVWSLAGTSWSQDAKPAAPPRWGAAIAQDDERAIFVFGGSDEAGC